MANFLGGDILEIVCQHTLGEFRFQAKSNESFTLDPGGVRTNDDANQTTGAGEIILQKNRMRWSIEGPIAVDFNSGNELDNLRQLAAHPELGVWTMTLISGTVYKGTGTVVGDLQVDTNTAQMTLKLAGSGEIEKI